MKDLLLNGMEWDQFLLYTSVALLGAFVYLARKVYNAIKTDENTPFKFSWKHLIKGMIKLVVALLLIPLIITNFEQIAPFVMKHLFSVPKELNIPTDITVVSAFITGFLMDYLVHKIFKVKLFDKGISKITP
jgi:hypothetical protein